MLTELPKTAAIARACTPPGISSNVRLTVLRLHGQGSIPSLGFGDLTINRLEHAQFPFGV